MSIAGVGRFHRTASIVVGQVHLPEKSVGGLEAGDSCPAELFDQPVLMGFKTPLHAAFGLRAVGPDDLNAPVLPSPGQTGSEAGSPAVVPPGWLDGVNTL